MLDLQMSIYLHAYVHIYIFQSVFAMCYGTAQFKLDSGTHVLVDSIKNEICELHMSTCFE